MAVSWFLGNDLLCNVFYQCLKFPVDCFNTLKVRAEQNLNMKINKGQQRKKIRVV